MSCGLSASVGRPDAVVAGWLASPGHRANILSPKYSEIGAGLVVGEGTYGTYWTQEFGSRPAASDDSTPQAAPDDQTTFTSDPGE